jgi:hypothetical protein
VGPLLTIELREQLDELQVRTIVEYLAERLDVAAGIRS